MQLLFEVTSAFWNGRIVSRYHFSLAASSKLIGDFFTVFIGRLGDTDNHHDDRHF